MKQLGVPPSLTYIGDVATILRGESRKLSLLILDEYILDTETVPGSFVCHVWCDKDGDVCIFSSCPSDQLQLSSSDQIIERFLHPLPADLRPP